VALGLRDERAHQAHQRGVDGVDFLAQPQAQVGRDLVVTRARGVQPLAGLADDRGQALLDVEMHVLGVERPGKAAAFDLAAHLGEAALDGRKIALRDDAGRREHARMGKRSGDVLLGETLVEADRGAKALYPFVDGLPESARPYLPAGPRLPLSGHARTISLNAV